MPIEPAPRFRPADAIGLAILLAVAALFTYGWTDFGWHQYLALRTPVFDFGINYQTIWAAAHGTELDLFGVGVGSMLLYLFVPVLYALGSEPSFFLFLFAFQAAWLAAGAIPLFLVARERLRHTWAALAIALAYLAFPALSGPVWFPFHFEALFPTLFLFGYWRYRAGSLWAAGGFWTAALFTHIGAVVVMGFFATGVIAEPFLSAWSRRFVRRFRRTGARPVAAARVPLRRTVFGIYLLTAAMVVFFVVAAYYGWFWFLHYVTKSGPSAMGLTEPLYSAPSWTNLPIQGWTMLLLFGSLLGLPFLAREERWAMVPYLALVLFTSQHGFWFPFRNQYPALLIGPLFAATVRGIERLRDRWPQGPAPVEATAPPMRRLRRPLGRGRVVPWTCGLVLVVVVASALYVAPWGPFNGELRSVDFLASGAYNDSPEFATNLTLDAQLRALAGSVPDDGVVLTQTELVEPLARPYYMVPSRYSTDVPLAYVLTDPYNPSFYGHNLDGPYNTSMLQWANYFLGQGWAVLGEVDGAVLLSATYAGPPRTFVPVDQYFGAAGLPCCGTPGEAWNGSTHGPWVAGPSTPYDGSYNVFAPGVYNLTFTLVVHDPRASDRIQCQVSANRGDTLLANVPVTGAEVGAVNGSVEVTVSFVAPAYELAPRISLHVAQWTGLLQLEEMHLLEVAPPPTLAGP